MDGGKLGERRTHDRPHDQAVALAYAQATRDAWKLAEQRVEELKLAHYQAVLDAWDAGVSKQAMAKALGVTRPRIVMIIKELREAVEEAKQADQGRGGVTDDEPAQQHERGSDR